MLSVKIVFFFGNGNFYDVRKTLIFFLNLNRNVEFFW